MTGYTVHTGSSEKFSQGWDQIFGKSGRKRQDAAKSQPATAPPSTQKSHSPSASDESDSTDSGH